MFPISPGEWLLTMKRSFLGIPLGTREFQVAGFNKVYYDTLDSLSLNVTPTAEPGETRFSLSALLPILNRLFVFLLCGGLALYFFVRVSGNSENGLLSRSASWARGRRICGSSEAATRQRPASLPSGFPRRSACRSSDTTVAAQTETGNGTTASTGWAAEDRPRNNFRNRKP